ncbi:putative tetratricopeptide-like helical domain superfamily [Helianthus annuus]|nr:putative tetratricopeptide-like helical domain superfamily [Helianthus annuus]
MNEKLENYLKSCFLLISFELDPLNELSTNRLVHITQTIRIAFAIGGIYWGNAAFKAKSWQKAIGFYTDAIKLNSTTATYFSNRAAAYLEVGSFIQAEADCTKAIDLDKKNVKAYVRRGTAREMLGSYKKAIEDFRYALVLEPTNKRAAVSADRLTKLFQ